MTSYFRIQTADRDAAELVDPNREQVSFSWYGPESFDRPGVSVCESREALAFYLANSGIPYGVGEWVIVELEGERIADADPMDAEVGEILVWPTAVLGVTPMDDEFLELVGAAFDRIGG